MDAFIGMIVMFGGNFAPRGLGFLQRSTPLYRAEHGTLFDFGHHLWR